MSYVLMAIAAGVALMLGRESIPIVLIIGLPIMAWLSARESATEFVKDIDDQVRAYEFLKKKGVDMDVLHRASPSDIAEMMRRLQ